MGDRDSEEVQAWADFFGHFIEDTARRMDEEIIDEPVPLDLFRPPVESFPVEGFVEVPFEISEPWTEEQLNVDPEDLRRELAVRFLDFCDADVTASQVPDMMEPIDS